MKKFQIGGVLLLLSLMALLPACSAPMLQSQIQFGIDAAQRDLWEEAIFRWKKALADDPNSAAAHNNLAVAYEKKGMWEEAEKEYKIALGLRPQDEHIESNYNKLKQLLEGMEDEREKKDEKK